MTARVPSLEPPRRPVRRPGDAAAALDQDRRALLSDRQAVEGDLQAVGLGGPPPPRQRPPRLPDRTAPVSKPKAWPNLARVAAILAVVLSVWGVVMCLTMPSPQRFLGGVFAAITVCSLGTLVPGPTSAKAKPAATR